MKRAVMVIANKGFRDEELLEPKDVLESNKIAVTIASSSLEVAEGKLGASVKPDILLDDVKPDDFDVLVFVGGSGSLQYWDNQSAHKLLKDAVSSGKVVAGICSAVVTLARAGILKGKKATVFPDDAQEIVKCGANYTASPVEKDGSIITASGPKEAMAFGEEIVKILSKQSL